MLSTVIAVAIGWLLLSCAAAAGWVAVRARLAARPADRSIPSVQLPPQRRPGQWSSSQQHR